MALRLPCCSAREPWRDARWYSCHLSTSNFPCCSPPCPLPCPRLNGGQMHDGAIFTPAPVALAGSDCDWIPAGGAAPLADKLKGAVAVVTLNRLPSEGIPAPCSYHRLAVAATQAEVAALVLGECKGPATAGYCPMLACQVDGWCLRSAKSMHGFAQHCFIHPACTCPSGITCQQWHRHGLSRYKATAPTGHPARSTAPPSALMACGTPLHSSQWCRTPLLRHCWRRCSQVATRPVPTSQRFW